MGKKNKKAKASGGSGASVDSGMPRSVRRESLEIVNVLLEKCSIPFGTRSGQEWGDYIDVYNLVERLRRIQKNYVLPSFNRDANMPGFMKWLNANGVDTKSVSIHKYDLEGHGVRAERDIEGSSLFLSVPRKLMLTTESAKESALGRLLEEDRILQTMSNVVLALHLLCERCTPDSFWQPYINILPNIYTTPLYYTPDEVQYFKGSPTFSEMLNQFRHICRQYAYFFKLFQGYTDSSKLPIKNFCFDDYRWAVSSVMTRQNQIPSKDGSHSCLALIPLWDMCNHTNGQITTDFSMEKDCSECYALRNFEKGEQVFIYYGSRSNAELFIHNGFVFPDNEVDRLAIKMGISKNDHLYSMKAEVLARLAILPSRIFYLHAGLDPVDSETLAYLRVFSMDQEELKERLMGENARELTQRLKDFGSITSYATEIKAWNFLKTRADLLLRAYPQTVEDDQALLRKGGLSVHHRLAIQLRLAEKCILIDASHYCGQQKTLMETHQLQMPPEITEADMDVQENDIDSIVRTDADEGEALGRADDSKIVPEDHASEHLEDGSKTSEQFENYDNGVKPEDLKETGVIPEVLKDDGVKTEDSEDKDAKPEDLGKNQVSESEMNNHRAEKNTSSEKSESAAATCKASEADSALVSKVEDIQLASTEPVSA